MGSVIVNDCGKLIGRVNFASLTGNGTVGNATVVGNVSNTAVNVLTGGTWTTSGTSTLGTGAFGPGNTTVASDTHHAPPEPATINTIGNATFAFGTTTTNTVTNGGTIRVGSDGAPSTLTLTGPAIALSNSGLIDLSTGAPGTQSLVGDRPPPSPAWPAG